MHKLLHTCFLIMLFVSVSVYGLKAERPFNRCLFYFSQSMRVLSHWFVISQNGDSKVAQTWHHMAGFMLIFFRSPPSRYAHTHTTHARTHTPHTHSSVAGSFWVEIGFGWPLEDVIIQFNALQLPAKCLVSIQGYLEKYANHPSRYYHYYKCMM